MKAIHELDQHRKAMGKRIAGLRKKVGLTQPQLADAAGIKQSSLSVLEAGKTVEVTARTLFGLCRALETTPEHLWDGAQADATEAELLAIYRGLPPALRVVVLQSARSTAATAAAVRALDDKERVELFAAIQAQPILDHEVEERIPATRAKPATNADELVRRAVNRLQGGKKPNRKAA